MNIPSQYAPRLLGQTMNRTYLEYSKDRSISKEPFQKGRENEYNTFYTKDKARLNANDLNAYQMSKAYQELYKKNLKEQYENVQWKEKQEYFKMSIQDLLSQFMKTMNDILLEISHLSTKYQQQLPVSYQDWVLIFIKDDRIFYVGLFLLMVSFFLFFIYTADN